MSNSTVPTFSGFATRQQETFYNKLLEKAVSLTVNKLIEMIRLNPGIFNPNLDVDLKFIKHIRKIYKYLEKMEIQKTQEPKFGESLEPIYKFFKENYEVHSDALSQSNSEHSVLRSIGANKGLNMSFTSHPTAELRAAKFELDQINESTGSIVSKSLS